MQRVDLHVAFFRVSRETIAETLLNLSNRAQLSPLRYNSRCCFG